MADQARCLLEDMPVDAFKIGVLGSVENIAAIAEIVSDYPDVPLVLDPVLASGRGDELATDEMTHAMRELLLPQTTILTPNSLEARRLADADDDEDAVARSVRRAARSRWAASTCSSPARTRATPQVVNTLYAKSGVVRTDTWPRLPGSYHGSGCTLASAIAAMLANGLDIARGRARSAGLHVAHAQEGLSARAWASSFPTACSGRARKPRRRGDDAEAAPPPMRAAAH